MESNGKSDVWGVWWPRFVAIVCLAIFVYVSIWRSEDRPYLFGSLVILIVGAPLGLVVEVWRRRNGG